MIFMSNDIEAHKDNNLIQGYYDDMGYDIRSGEDFILLPGRSKVVETGLHVCIPPVLGAFVKSKSGLSINHNIEAGNAGVIDSGYTGAIKVKMYNHDLNEPMTFKTGDFIAQLVFLVRPEHFFGRLHLRGCKSFDMFNIEEIPMNEWPESTRGNNGFGSTGSR